MTELSRLTVVIANWGTPDLTIRSATAVIGDGVPAERVVVVDNGSEDDSYARFQAELPACRLVRLEENIGFARASNRGAGILPGDAYLFVNNDAFVEKPGSVSALLACLQSPEVGVVAPRVLNPDLTLQPTVVPTSSPLVELVRASGLSRFVPNRMQPSLSTHWDHSEAREIQSVNGAVLLVRGRAWDELGGFEEQAYMYAEDLDLCWRARSAGWKVWFTPDAEFVHLGNVASGRHWSNPERAQMVGRAEAEMIHRHRSRPSAALTVGLISAGLAGRWLVYRATGNREAAASLRAGLRGYLGRARR
ncbi:MAG TPA: glycosyltransferase family 2 protein [Gaiellaceae bacterium]|nr:glycosyltransferase family 2 protein [Gaiellaceae bacterium]